MGRKAGRSKATSEGLQWDPVAEKQTWCFSHFRGHKNFLLAGSTGHKRKTKLSVMQGKSCKDSPQFQAAVCNEEMHQKVTRAFQDT